MFDIFLCWVVIGIKNTFFFGKILVSLSILLAAIKSKKHRFSINNIEYRDNPDSSNDLAKILHSDSSAW